MGNIFNRGKKNFESAGPISFVKQIKVQSKTTQENDCSDTEPYLNATPLEKILSKDARCLDLSCKAQQSSFPKSNTGEFYDPNSSILSVMAALDKIKEIFRSLRNEKPAFPAEYPVNFSEESARREIEVILILVHQCNQLSHEAENIKLGFQKAYDNATNELAKRFSWDVSEESSGTCSEVNWNKDVMDSGLGPELAEFSSMDSPANKSHLSSLHSLNSCPEPSSMEMNSAVTNNSKEGYPLKRIESVHEGPLNDFEKLRPVTLLWKACASADVQVCGSWDDWSDRTDLCGMAGDNPWQSYFVTVFLPVGRHHFKYIVDGEWRHDDESTNEKDAEGNINNVINVGFD